MQMLDTLATVRSDIGDHAIAVCESSLSSDLRNGFENTRDVSAVFRRHFIGRGDMSLGHNKNVHRRHRVDVEEGIYIFIFIYFLGRDLTVNDLTKQAIHF